MTRALGLLSSLRGSVSDRRYGPRQSVTPAPAANERDMSAAQTDGAARESARAIVARSAEQAAAFAERTGDKPCLATVLVGEDPRLGAPRT